MDTDKLFIYVVLYAINAVIALVFILRVRNMGDWTNQLSSNEGSKESVVATEGVVATTPKIEVLETYSNITKLPIDQEYIISTYRALNRWRREYADNNNENIIERHKYLTRDAFLFLLSMSRPTHLELICILICSIMVDMCNEVNALETAVDAYRRSVVYDDIRRVDICIVRSKSHTICLKPVVDYLKNYYGIRIQS